MQGSKMTNKLGKKII